MLKINYTQETNKDVVGGLFVEGVKVSRLSTLQ